MLMDTPDFSRGWHGWGFGICPKSTITLELSTYIQNEDRKLSSVYFSDWFLDIGED